MYYTQGYNDDDKVMRGNKILNSYLFIHESKMYIRNMAALAKSDKYSAWHGIIAASCKQLASCFVMFICQRFSDVSSSRSNY